jgi:primosomal protein N' (replication factor Y)
MPRYSDEGALPVRYVATQQGRTALDSGSCPDHLRDTLARIARSSRGILLSTIRKVRDPNTSTTIEALEQRSWIAASASLPLKTDGLDKAVQPINLEAGRRDHPDTTPPTPQPEADSLWTARVADRLHTDQASKILLHAPWEHRVHRLADAVRLTRAIGKSVIVLSGEIAKAEWLGRRLSALAECPVTVVSPSTMSDPLRQTRDGNALVVVGTRSAVFTPLRSIGLIWVDGEEDPAFKEPQEPRYHAREVAWMRAQAEGALLVLASTHPSLETAFDPGADAHAVRPDPTCRPVLELIDLNQEPRGALFSRRLVEAMHEALRERAGIVLFLNRKGYARTLVCRDCGWMPRCPVCAVTLAYSREGGRLTCRYCGKSEHLPQSCPLCNASYLHSIGDGTERVEAEAKRLFPQATVVRLDGDRLRRPSVVRDLWEGVRSGAWDILIGTQALFQREPLPRRGLVGILEADSGLHVPDFRAAERTYHLLEDAVSFARPASEQGRVVLQTRLPAHHAVQAVIANDPSRFYSEELAARRLLNYPPICHLAALSVSGRDPHVVETAATQWRRRLEGAVCGENAVTVLGPVPTLGRRPKGQHRWQLLAKAIDRALLGQSIRDSLVALEHDYRKRKVKFVVDMDPVDMS